MLKTKPPWTWRENLKTKGGRNSCKSGCKKTERPVRAGAELPTKGKVVTNEVAWHKGLWVMGKSLAVHSSLKESLGRF